MAVGGFKFTFNVYTNRGSIQKKLAAKEADIQRAIARARPQIKNAFRDLVLSSVPVDSAKTWSHHPKMPGIYKILTTGLNAARMQTSGTTKYGGLMTLKMPLISIPTMDNPAYRVRWQRHAMYKGQDAGTQNMEPAKTTPYWRVYEFGGHPGTIISVRTDIKYTQSIISNIKNLSGGKSTKTRPRMLRLSEPGGRRVGFARSTVVDTSAMHGESIRLSGKNVGAISGSTFKGLGGMENAGQGRAPIRRAFSQIGAIGRGILYNELLLAGFEPSKGRMGSYGWMKGGGFSINPTD
jgi:hypothetical protein